MFPAVKPEKKILFTETVKKCNNVLSEVDYWSLLRSITDICEDLDLINLPEPAKPAQKVEREFIKPVYSYESRTTLPPISVF